MGLCSLVGTIGRGVIVGVARFTGGSDQCGITKRSTEQDFFCQLWWTFRKMHTLQLFIQSLKESSEHYSLFFFLQLFLWLLFHGYQLSRLLCYKCWCCILVCMVSHSDDWKEVPSALTYSVFTSSIGSLCPCLWWSSCVHALRVQAMATVGTMWSAGWHMPPLLLPLSFQLQVILIRRH